MGYGMNLRQAVMEKGISVRRLGKNTDISPDTLYSAIRRDTGLRFDQALRVAEYLGIRPEQICGQCSFLGDRDGKARIDDLLGQVRDERKKDVLRKNMDLLMEFDEDLLYVIEMFLILLRDRSLEEGDWMIRLLINALDYENILLDELIGEETPDSPENVETKDSPE